LIDFGLTDFKGNILSAPHADPVHMQVPWPDLLVCSLECVYIGSLNYPQRFLLKDLGHQSPSHYSWEAEEGGLDVIISES
jgi:hypothetical protein